MRNEENQHLLHDVYADVGYRRMFMETKSGYGGAFGVFFAMDTYMTFTAYGTDAEPAILAAEDKIREMEELWSVTDKNSDVYAVNHSSGQTVTVDWKTAELLSYALDMAEETNGALEPTIYPVLTAWGFTTGENRVPAETELAELLEKVGYDKVELNNDQIQMEPGGMIDLGAVGKGYAGDEAAQILRERGITAALLDIGEIFRQSGQSRMGVTGVSD